MVITSEACDELLEELVLLFGPSCSWTSCVFCDGFFCSVGMDLGDELVDAVDHW